MKVTIKGYVHTRVSEWTGKREFTFVPFNNWTDCGYVLVGPLEFEYELPAGFNTTAAEIAALEAEKATVTAEFSRAVTKLNERISKLQAIEYTPAESEGEAA